MSNVVRAAVPLVKIGVTFVRANWKAIATALGVVSKFLADHPELPSRVRDRFTRIQERLLLQLAKPGVDSQIKGMLEVVREEASARDDSFDGKPWVDRADAIERDLKLAKLQPRSVRRTTFARLRGETDALVADLLEALAQQRAES